MRQPASGHACCPQESATCSTGEATPCSPSTPKGPPSHDGVAARIDMTDQHPSMASTWQSRLTRPLSVDEHRRIRVFLALIPVIGWSFAIWSTYAYHMSVGGHLDRSGHIKGHDFIHFYMI